MKNQEFDSSSCDSSGVAAQEWTVEELGGRRGFALLSPAGEIYRHGYNVASLVDICDAHNASLRLLREQSGCLLAGPARGDCAHFIGYPSPQHIPGQHDGPDDTVDVYGKPNGWCWSCWKDRQTCLLREQLEHVRKQKDFYIEARDSLAQQLREAQQNAESERLGKIDFMDEAATLSNANDGLRRELTEAQEANIIANEKSREAQERAERRKLAQMRCLEKRIQTQAAALCRLQSAITGAEVGSPEWIATEDKLCEIVEKMRRGLTAIRRRNEDLWTDVSTDWRAKLHHEIRVLCDDSLSPAQKETGVPDELVNIWQVAAKQLAEDGVPMGTYEGDVLP